MNLAPDTEGEGKMWNFMGIFSKNREEWCVVNLASMRSDITIIPLFDSLGLDALAYVINQTELSTMCIEAKQFDNLVKVKVEKQTDSLKNLVVFDPVTDE